MLGAAWLEARLVLVQRLRTQGQVGTSFCLPGGSGTNGDFIEGELCRLHNRKLVPGRTNKAQIANDPS